MNRFIHSNSRFVCGQTEENKESFSKKITSRNATLTVCSQNLGRLIFCVDLAMQARIVRLVAKIRDVKKGLV